ncbi:MAG: hypothetical protein HKM98_00415 [Gammaproteobacteria bacterium]|nr:hypothetical protein [Gammaproteobacteria bacterium]
MTINELIAAAGQYPWIIVLVLGPLPVVAWALGRASAGDATEAPWKTFYSVLVYAACVPGILASVLTAYSLFFTRANLLQVNVLIYILPIVVMIVTLALIGRKVDFALIPGFNRLSGLMIILAISFAVALFIVKTRIWLLFGSSMMTLVLVAVAAFFVLRWGGSRLFR